MSKNATQGKQSKQPTHAGIRDLARHFASIKLPLSEAAIRRHIIRAGVRETRQGYCIADVVAAVKKSHAENAPKTATEGLTSERERKIKLEADLLQVELDELSGKLVRADAVANEFAACAAAIKMDMLALASSLPGRLEGLSAVDISEILRDSINDALRHCSKNLMAKD